MSPGKSLKWINLLLSPKNGTRSYATESHLRKMTQRNFENMIKGDKVVIFSKTNCRCCEAAKSLFEDIRTRYTAIELDRREDGRIIQTHLNMITGSPIMPRIFILGKCIGGYDDLVEIHRNGTLIKLLNQD